MSPIKSHRPRSAGFTIVELLIAATLSGMVFAGIFSAYLFLGRTLTRQVNLQKQETESRRALRRFTDDVRSGKVLTTASSTQLAVTKPTASGTTSVTYTYSSANGTLARTDTTGTQTIASNLSSLSLSYFDDTGATATTAANVKSVELSFTSAIGDANLGTRISCATVSPRVLLRNKTTLQ